MCFALFRFVSLRTACLKVCLIDIFFFWLYMWNVEGHPTASSSANNLKLISFTKSTQYRGAKQKINSAPGSKAKNRWLSLCYIKLKSVFFKHICKNVNLNKIIIKELLYAGPMWSYLMYYVINASKSLKFPIQRTLIGGLLTVIYLSQICLNLLWEHLMLHC